MEVGLEIKFRGRHIETSGFVYGYLIGDDVIVGKIVEWDSEYFNTEFWCKVDPETVGQYTGIRDKNGKEIYEGDIVRLEDCGDIFDHIVKWILEEARFVFETTEDWYGPEEMDFDFCEVIGNVYENWDFVPG